MENYRDPATNRFHTYGMYLSLPKPGNTPNHKITQRKTTMSNQLILIIIIVISILLNGRLSLSEEYHITGTPRVIDGDSLEINDQRIRLYGIDAPELKQSCLINDKAYDCGITALKALTSLIAEKTVTCLSNETDQYNRHLSTCYVNETSINAWMVRNGHALSYRQYSSEFSNEEQIARKEKTGIHQGKHMEPWAWRRLHR